jgi:conjugal transfer pilus assembly protein TraW
MLKMVAFGMVAYSLFLGSNIALSKDFGKQGVTFEIAEEGFISMMKRRLSEMDITKHQNKMREIATKRINEPEAVAGIKRTIKAREFYYNPAYVLPEDIRLPCGAILHKAGTVVNPLDYMEFDRKLIFIDGRDKEQVQWLRDVLIAKRENEEAVLEDKSVEYNPIANNPIANKLVEDEDTLVEYNPVENKDASVENKPVTKMRIILTGGKILELQEELRETLYFDQAGELTSRFGIKQVPAIAQQEGKRIKISEIKI